MRPIFNTIAYIQSPDGLDAGLQMAVDELLLAKVGGGVVFRNYQWSEETVSIGHFGASSEIVDKKKPEQRLVRRPTGGGMVEHGHGRDFTYSIVIGAQEARETSLSPRASYYAIHQVLAATLRSIGIDAEMASDGESGSGGQACFANPVSADVMLGTEKIAGAGQKRSRGAILHQGSVQPVELPADFGLRFVRALASRVSEESMGSEFLAEAESLAASKYRTDEWNLCR